MELVRNEKGIALVLVMILALIGLVMVSTILFMVTGGNIMSGYTKQYKTVEEASYGGVQIFTEYMNHMGTVNLAGLNFSFTSGCQCDNSTPHNYSNNIDLMTGASSCRCDKLCNPTSHYGVLCDESPALTGVQVSLNPTTKPDMMATLSNYTVYAKIVDTVQGNTQTSVIVPSGQLGGGGVVNATNGVVSPPANPYLYRIEVEATATNNPLEQSRYTLLYAH